MVMRTLSLLSILVVLGTACDDFRTVVELDVPDIPDQLVVNSFYTPDSNWTVQITESRYVLDDDLLPFVDGATVRLYQGTNLLAETAVGDSGYYQLPFLPESSVDYTLEVSHPAFPAATAETALNPAVPLTSLSLDLPDNLMGVESMLSGELTFTDPAGVTNRYQLILYSTIEYPYALDPMGDTLWERFTYPNYFQLGANDSEELIDVNPDVFWFMPGQVFSDEIFEGQTVTLPIEINNDAAHLPPGAKWTLLAEFQTLSEDYYQYAFSYGVQRRAQGNPFAQPAQVFTNVAGGLGIVAGYTRAQITFKVLE